MTDMALYHYKRIVRDSDGDVVPSVTVEVNQAGSETNQDIFSDSGGTVKANPFTSDADGIYEFWVDEGAEIDIDFTKTGFSIDSLNNVTIPWITTSAPETRSIATTSPLTGGGDLTADRTLAFDFSTDETVTGTWTFDDLLTKRPWANARAYGLDTGGTGSANATALQAAIDAIEALGGGTVLIPEGTYSLDTTINVNKAVRIVGAGHGADTDNSFESDTSVTTLRWTGSSGTGPMFHCVSSTSGNWLFGVGFFNLKIDGDSLLTYGIRAEACRRSQFGAPGASITIWGCQTAGVWCAGGNGAIWTSHCEFHLLYRRGSGAATESSHGLLLGDPSADTLACTQHTIWKLWGQIHTGDLLRIVGNADNNRVYWLHAVTEPSQAGFGLNLVNGASQHPRNNVFYYLASTGGTTAGTGGIHVGSSTRGNVILHMTAETCSVQIDSGGQLHYQVVDEQHADYFQTLRYRLSDALFVGVRSAAVTGSGAAEGTAASLWPSVDIDQATAGAARFLVEPPPHWSTGTITKVRIHFTHPSAASSDTWRLDLRISTKTLGTSIGSQESTFNEDVSVNDTANLWETAEITVDQGFLRDQLITCSVLRESGHANDDLAQDLQILGVTFVFQSDGPDSGSQTYNVSDPHST